VATSEPGKLEAFLPFLHPLGRGNDAVFLKASEILSPGDLTNFLMFQSKMVNFCSP
jgi:hypothetical protein